MKSLLLLVVVCLVIGQAPPTLKALHIIPESNVLSERQAITIVFNRAVISLGSDFGRNYTNSDRDIPFKLSCTVPGWYRWVTTSIFRFDPTIDWPTNLKCQFQLNRALKTFDGLSLSEPRSKVYTTHPLQMYITNVVSNKTLEFTGGMWGTDNSNPECPPDAEIQLGFNDLVDLNRLQSLRLRSGNTQVPIRIKGYCGGSDRRCAAISFTKTLTRGRIYRLEVAAGFKVNPYAGSSTKTLFVNMRGLRDFKFYFNAQDGIRFNRWDLWLIHGLSNNTKIEDFQRAIQITPQVNTKITRPSLGLLEIEAKFLPNTKYTIQVAATNSIRDAYDLPLMASSTSFKTGNYTEFIGFPEQSFVSMSQVPDRWEVLRRGEITTSLLFGNINSSNLDATIKLFLQNPDTRRSFLFKALSVPQDNTLLLHHVNTLPLLGSTGIFLTEKRVKNPYGQWSQFYLVNQVKIAVHSLTMDPETIIFWITQIDDAIDVRDAQITLFKNGEPWKTMNTNSEGMAVFTQVGQSYQKLAVAVEYNGEIVIFDDIQVSYTTPATTMKQCYMFTDRKLYKIGDTVYIKGYLKEFDIKTQKPIQMTGDSLFVNFNNMNEIRTPFDPRYGSFDTTLTLPENSTFGTNWISARFGEENPCSAEILIADPRIPSVDLTMSSNSTIARFDRSTRFNVNLKTYTGTPINKGKVNLKWKIFKPPIVCPLYMMSIRGKGGFIPCRGEEKVLASGNQDLVTNADGNAEFLLNVPESRDIEVGDHVEVTSAFFAPSRETLEEKIQLIVAPSDLKLIIEPSIQEILPGFFFQVLVSLEHANGTKVIGRDVTISLYEWESSSPPSNSMIMPNLGSQVSLTKCKIQSNNGKKHICNFTLPKLKKYILVGSTKDLDGSKVHGNVLIGKTYQEWQKSPLKKPTEIKFTLDKEEYKIGEIATIEFYSPFTMSYALIAWNSFGQLEHKKEKFYEGFQKINIPVTEKCRHGCKVSIQLFSPNGHGIVFKDGLSVPTSVVYDPKQAQFVQSTVTIPVSQEKAISVNLTPKDVILHPRATSSANIKLFDKTSGNSISGEVVFWIVDKSILDLKPNPIQSQNLFQFHAFLTNMLSSSSIRSFVSSKVYQETFKVFKQRFLRDPYIYQNWNMFDDWNTDADLSDEEFFKKWNTILTEIHYQSAQPLPGGIQMMDSAERGGMARSTKSFSAPIDGNAPSETGEQVRSSFVMTPVWIAKKMISEQGQDVEFALPDNIGSYVVNAFAIGDDSSIGYTNTTIITKKIVNLYPSAPRFVRHGDFFSAGVSITLSDQNFEGDYQISLENQNPDLVKVLSTQKNITLSYSDPLEALFEFNALAMGSARLIFRLTGPSTDSIQIDIPILYIQEPVTITSSFAVSQTSNRTEGFDLPKAVGIPDLNITTGLGRLPSIISLSNSLLHPMTKEFIENTWCFPSSYFSMTFPKALFDKYYPGKVPAELVERSTKFYELVWEKLVKCTNHAGLQFGNVINSYDSLPYLNLMGIYMYKELKDMNAQVKEDTVEYWKNSLKNYLSGESKNHMFDLYAYSHYVLGDEWNPTKVNQTIPFLAKNLKLLSKGAKSAIAMVFLKKRTYLSLIDPIMTELMDGFRIQGRTAYIEESVGGQRASQIYSSMLMMDLFIQRSVESPLMEKFANWFSSYSTSDSGFNVLALAKYDQYRGNTRPDLLLNVKMDDVEIIKRKFDDTRAPVESKELELKGNEKMITFDASGTGEASIAVSVTFEPMRISNDPNYRGIYVNKVIKRVDPITNQPIGSPVTSAEPGTLLVVLIELTTPDDLTEVQVVDPVSAGFEIVDPNIKDSVYPLYRLPIPLFYGQYKKDQVLFMTPSLSAGSHMIQYNVYAVSNGNFIVSPTKAFVRTQPEVMGLSKTDSFMIN